MNQWIWILMWVAIGAIVTHIVMEIRYRRRAQKKARSDRKNASGPSFGPRPPRPRPEPPPRPTRPAPECTWETTRVVTSRGTNGNTTIELSGSTVKFSKDGEVVYEGPLDDAPDEVIRATMAFRQGIGKINFDMFDGIMENFNQGMDEFRKGMDEFGKEMDEFGKEMDKL